MLLKEEIDFYAKHRWALMPFLSMKQIMQTLNSMIDENIQDLPDWCRNEWNLNLYLLSSAAADLVDDYLVRGIIDFGKVTDYFSFLNFPVKLLLKTTTVTSRIWGSLIDASLRRWRESWTAWLNVVCTPLVKGENPSLETKHIFKDALMPLLSFSFPSQLLKMRIRIPAAYRSQDLTHHDFITLSEKYMDSSSDKDSPIRVLGLRTAGSFIAPIVCAKLRAEGFRYVGYMTIRPKNNIHPWVNKQMKDAGSGGSKFIVVDEPAGTGKTIIRCINMLRRFGVRNENITILVPTHPANRDWLNETFMLLTKGANIITLSPEEWYKARLLERQKFYDSIAPYFSELGTVVLEVKESKASKKINYYLEQNPDGAYHVRLKKVYEVTLQHRCGLREKKFLMGKSVGWGWLGYHAALAAEYLANFIPKVYGVRNGILYWEWIDASIPKNGVPRDKHLQILSNYIAQRTNYLRLIENPMPYLSAYRESGLQSIAIVLSKVFGEKLSKLKRGWMRHHLERLVLRFPTFLDARMRRNEWILSENGMVKADFEHHGFSKTASHNIADPAYDIAAAMFEFDLNEQEKAELLQSYVMNTGDKTIGERLIFYKLLVGTEVLAEAVEKLNTPTYSSSYQELNERYVRAWNYLVLESMHHCAGLCDNAPVSQWQAPMFVMDIDDVLDKNIFGFPSTSADGIRALSLLRSHSICSIINTARSLDEVKAYCYYYGFPGGIAEYGSVMWDAVEKKVHSFVSDEAMAEFDRVRDALRQIPGVFLNPYYKYSIRAYSFDNQRTIPVPTATVTEIFRKLSIKHLLVKKSYIDTAILFAATDKGRALSRLKNMKQFSSGKIGAIGDSESDFPMLKVADQGFLVYNSSAELKRSVRSFGIHVLSSSFQSGLLEGVKIFVHDKPNAQCKKCREVLKKLDKSKDTLWSILRIADMTALQRWFKLFDKRIFEFAQE